MYKTMLLAGLLVTSAAAARPFEAASVPDIVADGRATVLGDVDPAQRMHVSVSLPMRDPAGRDAVLRDLYDPQSPRFHRFLSVAEYADRFGPTQADYDEAATFFRGQGLAVRADAANRALLQLDGTAADMQRIFHVHLHSYRHPTEDRRFFAPDTEPYADNSVRLLEVMGLDDAVLPTPRLVWPSAGAPSARTTGSGPNGKFLGSDMRAAYYGRGPLDGSGQSVGLMELIGYNVASVQTYFATVGQPLAPAIVTVATDTVSPDCTGTCNDVEQALDIEYTISMAPGLKSVEVYVGHPEDVLNSMASRRTSLQLSTSWGWRERFATDDAIFKEMAIQGQTMLTASGDNSSLRASGPWPEEDANLTAVGGTDLVTDGPGGAWKRERGWRFSAGGPSVDPGIGIEDYQVPYVTAANGASHRRRNVPDVAAQAQINMFLCGNPGCGYAGGTSFASPMWAGFVAMANQAAASTGHGMVGFINPVLYRSVGHIGGFARLLHDQTVGTSGRFQCTPSFDLVTGLGSMNRDLIGILAAQ